MNWFLLFVILHPVIGWIMLWAALKPKTYGELIIVILAGITLGWFTLSLVSQLAFWDKPFRK